MATMTAHRLRIFEALAARKTVIWKARFSSHGIGVPPLLV
jgi:hypothetical protein